MEKCKRLFDLLPRYQELFGNKSLLNAKVDAKWISHSIKEVIEKSDMLAVSLMKMDISGNDFTAEKQSKVGLISANRPEWVITDFAVQKTGGVLVPIYPSISLAELEFILTEAQIEVLFISDKSLYRKIKSVVESFTSLKTVISFDEIEGINNWQMYLNPISENEKLKLEEVSKHILSDHLATIIYTSGTTGNPKGVMLSHKNLISNITNCMPCFTMCDENSSVLSFLPLNHIFERTVTYIYIRKGVSIFYAEGMETIGENLREVKPSLFTTVPRLLEKVYERITIKGSELTGLKRHIFDWAMNLAIKFELEKKYCPYKKIEYYLADKLVYSKWREAIGGNVKAIIVGSAACQIKLLKIFTCAKLVVMEGYGLTETSPVISVNRYEKENRKFGTVGQVIDNCEVKIADDGEIIFRGDNIMMGYYKNQLATDEMIKDNWIYTGDIGIYENGFLKITDRKKELFKISGGKYVAPLPLENKIKESPYIEQIMVLGANEKYVGALIVPSIKNLKTYFQKINSPLAEEIDLTTDIDTIKLIRSEINIFNKGFAEHEQVKRFQLLANEWTIDGGELTPKLSLKRKKIVEKYQAEIELIFRHSNKI
ncbi:MAG: long-chain fatty acid--CoA ligase [Chitinophagaceae bacterium]|nr:long-chain fatty acid--CoA ligase [Chitinophagaceae bacterium]